MSESTNDHFFFTEMMAHPALFVHSKPQRIAILGEGTEILSEVLKHPNVQHVFCIQPVMASYADGRVTVHQGDPQTWLKTNPEERFDIIIDATTDKNYSLLNQALKPDGILVQPCYASLMDPKNLKLALDTIQLNDFHDVQLLNFPQPGFSQGWRTIVLISKDKLLRRIREKDIYNRNFTTRYYNYDTHKAALALPEFIREELEPA